MKDTGIDRTENRTILLDGVAFGDASSTWFDWKTLDIELETVPSDILDGVAFGDGLSPLIEKTRTSNWKPYHPCGWSGFRSCIVDSEGWFFFSFLTSTGSMPWRLRMVISIDQKTLASNWKPYHPIYWMEWLSAMPSKSTLVVFFFSFSYIG